MVDRRGVVIGAAGGSFSGFFGIGGGMLLVPLIMMLYRPSRRVAHATSLGSIVALSTAGMAGFALDGNVEWVTGVAMGLGGVIGAVVGATLLDRLAASTLRLLFAVVLIVAGVKMVF